MGYRTQGLSSSYKGLPLLFDKPCRLPKFPKLLDALLLLELMRGVRSLSVWPSDWPGADMVRVRSPLVVLPCLTKSLRRVAGRGGGD
jgi:hypothetical protein